MQIHLHHTKMPEYDRMNFVFMTAIGTAIGLGTGVAATIGGAALVGTAAYGATKLIGGKQQPSSGGGYSAQAAEPSYDRAAALAQKDSDKKRRGIARNQPNYTGPTGLTPLDKSNINLKELTGV